MREELRTYVHELTHFVQSTTTPYGLFLHYCREVQTADTIVILRALIKAGEPIRRPLLDAAPLDLKGELGATIRGGLNRWASVELLVAYLAQDGPAYQHYLQRLVDRPAEIDITPPMTTFRRIQGGIAHVIATENAGRQAAGMEPWDNGNFDVNAINAEGEEMDNDRARALERMTMALEAFGNPWGTESILESAATAAEWAESGSDLNALRAYAADASDPDLAAYKQCLERGLEAIQTDNLQQFAFTFIAMCELALHAPVLPHHATLRKGSLDPAELFPPLRFQMLLGEVGKIRPLEDLADVSRFYLDLCAALHWVPLQMVSVALSGPQTVSDHRTQRYIWAQGERARRMHAFTNLLRRMVPGQNVEQFQDRYAFPVIEYSDKTLYMRDKDALWWLSMQHLLTKTMRQVVLGKTLTVTSPYRGAPEEAKALTSGLQEMLQNLFGRPFPMAQVVDR